MVGLILELLAYLRWFYERNGKTVTTMSGGRVRTTVSNLYDKQRVSTTFLCIEDCSIQIISRMDNLWL